MSRVWIDVTGIRQANMLSTLASEIAGNAEILVTTSSDPRPARILRFHKVPGVSVPSKARDTAQRYADRVLRLSRRVRGHRPDILISDLDPSAVRTAFGLGIPCWTVYAANGASSGDLAIEAMSYPLCDRIFASRFLDRAYLAASGVPSKKIVEFAGFNECYVRHFRRTKARSPRVLLRPNGHDSPVWVGQITKGILRGIAGTKVTILGKPDRQTVRLSSVSNRVRFLDFTPYPPVVKQDLYIGWGRMLGESYAMGIPSIRTVEEDYPDLSVAYADQPAMNNPSRIVETSQSMIHGPCRSAGPGGLESPVGAVMAELCRDGFVS